jgi:sRNA-binding protein
VRERTSLHPSTKRAEQSKRSRAKQCRTEQNRSEKEETEKSRKNTINQEKKTMGSAAGADAYVCVWQRVRERVRVQLHSGTVLRY